MFKKPVLSLSQGFVRPEQNRRKGRSPFDVRSVRFVRERERREERQGCEPEGDKRATMSGRSQRTPLVALRPDSGQTFFNIPFIELAEEDNPIIVNKAGRTHASGAHPGTTSRTFNLFHCLYDFPNGFSREIPNGQVGFIIAIKRT